MPPVLKSTFKFRTWTPSTHVSKCISIFTCRNSIMKWRPSVHVGYYFYMVHFNCGPSGRSLSTQAKSWNTHLKIREIELFSCISRVFFCFRLYIYIYSSEIRCLCLMKWPSETLQNLPYFWNTKTWPCSFFHFVLLYFFP